MSSSSVCPFAFGESLVRVRVDDSGNPWFVAKDVARALDYEWNGMKNIQHVPEEWRGVESVSTPSGEQEMLALSEPGLYFFLGRSDKPKALPFQKWLAGEVLPALRRTGRYEMPGHPSGPARHGMPDALPAEALALRPAMRCRLWQDALQTARLDGQGSDAACRWFAFLCRMAVAAPPAPAPAEDKVRAFVAQCCEHAEGSRVPAGALYAAFRRWHRGQRGPLPSMRAFGMFMQEHARRCRSNGSVYDGVRLKKAAS